MERNACYVYIGRGMLAVQETKSWKEIVNRNFTFLK